jgi:integrase/recombinase XerD
MSALAGHVEDYLRVRRALGFKLERAGRILPQLVAFLEAAGATTMTSQLAIAWARQPAGAQPQHWAARLTIARGFAAYLHTLDPAAEIPPAGVFAVRYRRSAPYLWAADDIERLLEAARGLRSPLRAATFETLFGLLAVTGMRTGETLALQRDDIDLGTGVITIRTPIAKGQRARVIPLHPTTIDALRRYTIARERLCPRPRSTTFFVSGAGTALDPSGVAKTLRQLTTALGLRSDTVHPRATDLRHTYAVRTLIDWQRSGQIAPRIAILSTYLGHIRPAETYWYLSATPELMGLAADRLQARFAGPR